MHRHPAAVFMMFDIPHSELQDEDARFGLAWEVYGDDPRLNPAISRPCHDMGAVLVRAFQLLKSIRWTMLLMCRGAVARRWRRFPSFTLIPGERLTWSRHPRGC
jgi:hypothetical protein